MVQNCAGADTFLSCLTLSVTVNSSQGYPNKRAILELSRSCVQKLECRGTIGLKLKMKVLHNAAALRNPLLHFSLCFRILMPGLCTYCGTLHCVVMLKTSYQRCTTLDNSPQTSHCLFTPPSCVTFCIGYHSWRCACRCPSSLPGPELSLCQLDGFQGNLT
jgi:hypothetical protein